MVWIRHGDVILEKVDKQILGESKKEVILAYGEVTGHKHKLVSEQILEVIYPDGRYIELEQEGSLTHEEHDTLQIPPGTYKVLIQREVDLLGEVRQVLD